MNSEADRRSEREKVSDRGRHGERKRDGGSAAFNNIQTEIPAE